MKVRRVNRYSCDFCKKSNCSGASIKKHEAHCTLNPDRVCGVCEIMQNDAKALTDLIALLPVPVRAKGKYGEETFQDGFEAQLNIAVPVLREAAKNCPACMMAALRQAKIPVPLAGSFNFTNEMKSIWSDINNQDERGYSY